MSHIVTIDVEIKSLDTLKKAADYIGMDFKEGVTNYKWYGSTEDTECDHVLSVKGNPDAYEIGVKKNDDKWDLLWDSFQGGYGLVEVVGNEAETLIQEYSVQAAIATAYEQGYSVDRRVNQEGEVILTAYI